MKTEIVKGICEYCGFAYQGKVNSPYPAIACPQCKRGTQNFDDAHSVDERNKEEDTIPDYIECELKTL